MTSRSTATPLPTLQPGQTPIVGSAKVAPKDGMQLVYVPADEFLMGSPDGEGASDERPQHTVYLDAYWIDRTEVTNAMYEKCVDDGVCRSASDYGADFIGSNQPVVAVFWNDASAYCQWAERRLPTEAEWEKAALGTDGRTYPWGNAFDGNKLNYCDTNCSDDWKDEGVDDGYEYTAPVGSYPAGASPYGALDMTGNVTEWVADWYDSDYYSLSPARNPTGPKTGDYRVLRGGAWNYNQDLVRSALRSDGSPDTHNNNVGFRCALSEEHATKQEEVTESAGQTPTPTPSPTTVIIPTPTNLGIGSTMISEKDGMELLYVPVGELLMGSPDGEGDRGEHPQHTVYLDAFWIDKTEVSNAMYEKCVADGVCQSTGNSGADFTGSNQPVVGVSWHDASAYCEWAGRRLPSEAEWEKAARGMDGRIYPWGNESPDSSLLNYSYDVGRPTEVGNYPVGASPYGALDMAGNVWEWVGDRYDSDYYSQSPERNPTGPESGSTRVLRGGSWGASQDFVRSAYRGGNTPDNRNNSIGFRCALSQ